MPQNPVTGTIDSITPAAPQWGDTVTFALTIDGHPKGGDNNIWVHVAASQAGDVVFNGWALGPFTTDGVFLDPTVTFDGVIDPAQPADATATLTYRQSTNGKYPSIRFDLDVVSFTIAPAG